ncbi:MAG: hypothetical protein HW405_249 [Candidatus Berkelbacteria bacterium]|nr:hypothetical protein [Candidatus Berkelbacteria bacterium]
MSTWEVIKTLFKGARLYRRQAIFLVLLVGLGYLFYSGWLTWGRSEAAVAFKELPLETLATKTTQIEVKENGDVFIDGQKHNEALQFYQKNDELRVKIFDSSGEYIPSFKAIVKLPATISQNQVHQIVYAIHGVGSYSSRMQDSQTRIYEAQDISPSSTLTIVAELPKGLVTPNFWQKIKFTFSSLPVETWLYVAIVLPGITLVILLFMVLKRKAAQFLPIKGLLGGPPEDISPAVSGVLIDGVVGAREIAATLIDLARRGSK